MLWVFPAPPVIYLERVLTRYFSSNDRQVELVLGSATRPALLAIGLEATNEDSFGLLKTRLSKANVKFFEERDVYPGVANLIRFFLPSGHPVELHSSAGETNQSFYPTSGVRPRRLGHALLKVEDIPNVEAFFTEILSFRVSDRGVGGEIVWLRCSEIHHSINLLHGPPGLHHYAWEVDQWAFFKQLGDVLRGHRSQLVWGPGRHGPGNNLLPITKIQQVPWWNILLIFSASKTRKAINGVTGVMCRSGTTSGATPARQFQGVWRRIGNLTRR
jgi:catechol 2,3-dioxygenase-like lactoylglutathione lyase family enzyme